MFFVLFSMWAFVWVRVVCWAVHLEIVIGREQVIDFAPNVFGELAEPSVTLQRFSPISREHTNEPLGS